MARPPGGRRPTSHDVAAAAGVSRATVSFVLNDTPSQTISEQTRQAVLAAAESLGYVPSAAARMLRSGRSHLVLFLVPSWATTEALTAFVQLTARRLAEQGYVAVSHTTVGAPLTELLTTTAPAAVVTLAPIDPADETRLRRLHVPHVSSYLADYPEHPHSMTLTQQAMGATQVRHLLARGYRRLLYVHPADVGYAGRADGRYAGAATAADAGGGVPVERVAYADVDGLHALARTLLDAPDRTGVCAFDDAAALEVLATLLDHGVPVPDRVGLVGVDDVAAARLVRPALSTVRLDLRDQADELAARVHAAVTGGQAAGGEAAGGETAGAAAGGPATTTAVQRGTT